MYMYFLTNSLVNAANICYSGITLVPSSYVLSVLLMDHGRSTG